MPPVTKPPGRQTNNSLSSIPESLLLASCAPAAKVKKTSGKSVSSSGSKKEKEKSVDSGGTGSSSSKASTGGGAGTKAVPSSNHVEGSGSGSKGAASGGDEKPGKTKQNAAAGRKKKEKSQV